MSLHLGAFHFDGDPEALLAPCERLVERFPLETPDVHVCVAREGGLTVFDACPSKAVHAQFVRSTGSLGAIAAAGLPTPRTEGLGDIRVAHVRQMVQP
jgi:hypothetical protein